MGLQSGHRYKLTNVKNADCVLDLSGADSHSLIGYSFHGGDNQKWEFRQVGNGGGWTIRSVAVGRYAAPEGSPNSKGEYANGTKVVVSDEEYIWKIEEEDGALRISTLHGKKSFDLSNHGAGPNVEVWGTWQGKNQLWNFEEI